MKTSNLILFDTNILVYNQDQDNPHYKIAAEYHRKALDGTIKAAIAIQNLLEFSAVMINPKKIKMPLSQKDVTQDIEKYIKSGGFDIVYPNNKTILVYLDLLNRYQVKVSRQVFDLFLIATMLSNNIQRILTFNKKDFSYKEIKVVAL